MRVLGVIGLLVVAACGADGPPFVPTASGNVTLGTNGVSTSTTLGATNGTVSVGLRL